MTWDLASLNVSLLVWENYVECIECKMAMRLVKKEGIGKNKYRICGSMKGRQGQRGLGVIQVENKKTGFFDS